MTERALRYFNEAFDYFVDFELEAVTLKELQDNHRIHNLNIKGYRLKLVDKDEIERAIERLKEDCLNDPERLRIGLELLDLLKRLLDTPVLITLHISQDYQTTGVFTLLPYQNIHLIGTPDAEIIATNPYPVPAVQIPSRINRHYRNLYYDTNTIDPSVSPTGEELTNNTNIIETPSWLATMHEILGHGLGILEGEEANTEAIRVENLFRAFHGLELRPLDPIHALDKKNNITPTSYVYD